MTPEWMSTVNGIDFALFLGCVLLFVTWMGNRDRWRQRLQRADEASERWAARCVEAQGALEALQGSIAAEVEARLDAAVEVALETAEQVQLAHDRVEALAEAVRRRLETQGLIRSQDADADAADGAELVARAYQRHRMLAGPVPRRDFRIERALRRYCQSVPPNHVVTVERGCEVTAATMLADLEADGAGVAGRYVDHLLETACAYLGHRTSREPADWLADADTPPSIEPVKPVESIEVER